ncbi:hypothetical protein BCR44DRAFT_1240061 [Catenaria anguillulae PL171]|uniref:Uncharacterized protein n=1 Tax=Catenaria anguillulae PL171 TaxID=765915 RepID=A0A1Y2HFC8_9FUNG|nr:hypothetical protein BCR44DRAFT_1240061 [Catenaria anguillulae PL171]
MGKLLFDRILTSVHKGFEPYEAPLGNDPKSNNNSLKSLAGSKPVLAPGAAGKKGGAADKPPPLPPMTLAANLPMIPAAILRPVLDAYLVKLVAFHTIPSAVPPGAGTTTGHHGHGAAQQQQAPAADTGKHQVLPAKVADMVVQYFRTTLLSQIRLIRLAFTSIPRRYSKTYATSRPSSSFNRVTADDSANGGVAEIHDWRIPAQMRGASRNPPTTGMAAIWYNEPGMVEMDDSDLDEDGPPQTVVVGHGGAVSASAAGAMHTAGGLRDGKRESGGGGLVGELQEEMAKALVGVVKGAAGTKDS